MTRVILYCRVSTDEQAYGHSLEVQERYLRAYCSNHGYEVIDVYKKQEKPKKNDNTKFKKHKRKKH